METLLVVAQHRNQYYSKSKTDVHTRFGSSPSRDFRGINCRTFHSGIGILPTPLKSYSSPSPVAKRPYSSSSSSSSSTKSPSTPAKSNSDNKIIITPKSTPVPINRKTFEKVTTLSEDVLDGSMLLSELWAGPTYSNSPPPSSLPMPKFSIWPKRTVSLELPGSSPEIELHPVAKSAPSSPHKEYYPNARDLFDNADSASKTLRRILNINIDDD